MTQTENTNIGDFEKAVDNLIECRKVLEAIIKTVSNPLGLFYMSHLTPRIDFISWYPDEEDTHDWLEIKWGKGSMRLDIHKDKLHINCYPLELHQDANRRSYYSGRKG